MSKRILLAAALVLSACTPQTLLGDRTAEGTSGGVSTSTAPGTSTSAGETTAESGSDSSSSSSSGGSSSTSESSSSSESTAAEPFAVVGFRLADADADLLLDPLSEGDVVDPAAFGGAALSLAADTSPTEVGSLQFFVDDVLIRVEDFVPYTLGGNLDFDIQPWDLTPGVHTVRAVPFELADGGGAEGIAREVTFELL